MKIFGKFQKLLLALIAIIGLPIAASHLCSVFSHTPSHHGQNQTVPLSSVTYSTESAYKQCCVNKTHSEQLTTSVSQVQKFIAGFQIVLINAFRTPISTAYASSNLPIPPQSDKHDPGGGLVLRC